MRSWLLFLVSGEKRKQPYRKGHEGIREDTKNSQVGGIPRNVKDQKEN